MPAPKPALNQPPSVSPKPPLRDPLAELAKFLGCRRHGAMLQRPDARTITNRMRVEANDRTRVGAGYARRSTDARSARPSRRVASKVTPTHTVAVTAQVAT